MMAIGFLIAIALIVIAMAIALAIFVVIIASIACFGLCFNRDHGDHGDFNHGNRSVDRNGGICCNHTNGCDMRCNFCCDCPVDCLLILTFLLCVGVS